MNIIISNKYRDLLINSNVEIMKEVNGVFKISDLVNNFKNMYYKKIIIDATSLERFPKDDVLRELVRSFDADKLILFLPPDNTPPKKFLEFLVSIGLYNFTDNINGMIRLVQVGNKYEDMKDYINLEKEENNGDLDINNDFSNEAPKVYNGKIILGVKNVTKSAGATSLIYMLKKNLVDVYNQKVLAIEIDKRDFYAFQDKDMISISSNQVSEFLNRFLGYDLILVDLGTSSFEKICSDVIYLVEPSLFKINQLLFKDRNAFSNYKGKKVILNKSMLSENDTNLLAREAGISIYFNMPPLNDRIINPVISELLLKLGYIMDTVERNKKSLFDIFK